MVVEKLQFLTLYIDADDFVFELEKGMKKLSPNGRVRLMNGYVIDCNEVITDANNNIVELKCSYLPETLGGKKPEDGKKPNGIVHWVDANNCIDAEIRLYVRLFNTENPAKFDDIKESLNDKSIQILKNAKLEKSLADANNEEHFQFNRIGYFVEDQKDSYKNKLVFNRTVTLRNVWEVK